LLLPICWWIKHDLHDMCSLLYFLFIKNILCKTWISPISWGRKYPHVQVNFADWMRSATRLLGRFRPPEGATYNTYIVFCSHYNPTGLELERTLMHALIHVYRHDTRQLGVDSRIISWVIPYHLLAHPQCFWKPPKEIKKKRDHLLRFRIQGLFNDTNPGFGTCRHVCPALHPLRGSVQECQHI
jgi:hypothetical protein